MKIGRLLLRLAVGGFFVGDGTQKLFDWFPGRRNAIAAAVAEARGGALLATGLATPLAASVLSLIVISYATKKPSEEKLRPFFEQGL